MIHPHTELKFINSVVGYGVVATKFIPAGTITWVLDKLDKEITPNEYNLLEPHYQTIIDTYTYRNNLGNFVLCWDLGKYVNHSFKSNCLTTAYDFEIAIRDIQPGEQLTDDYGYLNVSEPFEGEDEGTDRKIVYPDDLPNYHQVWDKQIDAVFPKIINLQQPLQHLISKKTWSKIEQIIQGKEKRTSILANYFNGN